MSPSTFARVLAAHGLRQQLAQAQRAGRRQLRRETLDSEARYEVGLVDRDATTYPLAREASNRLRVLGVSRAIAKELLDSASAPDNVPETLRSMEVPIQQRRGSLLIAYTRNLTVSDLGRANEWAFSGEVACGFHIQVGAWM